VRGVHDANTTTSGRLRRLLVAPELLVVISPPTHRVRCVSLFASSILSSKTTYPLEKTPVRRRASALVCSALCSSIDDKSTVPLRQPANLCENSRKLPWRCVTLLPCRSTHLSGHRAVAPDVIERRCHLGTTAPVCDVAAAKPPSDRVTYEDESDREHHLGSVERRTDDVTLGLVADGIDIPDERYAVTGQERRSAILAGKPRRRASTFASTHDEHQAWPEAQDRGCAPG